MLTSMPKQVLIRKNDKVIFNVAYDRIEGSVVGNAESVVPKVLEDLFKELIANGPFGLDISFRQCDGFKNAVKEKRGAQERPEGQQGTQKVDEGEEEGKEHNKGSEETADKGEDDGAKPEPA